VILPIDRLDFVKVTEFRHQFRVERQV
jgi:hypothetical protein